MSKWYEHCFCRFVAKVLVFLMVVQGWPLYQLSQSYQWSPQRYVELFNRAAAFFAPGEAHAGTVTGNIGAIFGPRKYVRTTGEPNEYTDSFSIQGQTTACTLVITNGDESGKHRISSAVIRLNGEQLFGPNDFNQQVGKLEVSVNLIKNNTIYLELASQPEGYLTVQIIGYRPVANSQSTTTEEDSPVEILLSGSDAEGDTLTFAVASEPSHGALSGEAPNLTYTPDANYNGADAFDFIANDGALDSEPATVAITVTPVNDSPQAIDDMASTDEDTAVDIVVLGNDTDVDGDVLTVQGVTQPTNGSATVNQDGTVGYTPNQDFNGTDSFTYTVNDGNGGTDTATVTITVKPVNDPPVASSDSAVTDEDTAVTTVNVLANDTDVDGDTLSVLSFTQPANGTVVANGDGTFTYTPATDFNGNDNFYYVVTDGNYATAAALVNITVNPVNDPPEITSSPVTDGTEDQPYTYDVEATDADNDVLTYSLTVFPQGMTIDPATGLIGWTPTEGQIGSHPVTVKVSDGNGGADTQSFVVEVSEAPNNPPVITSTPVANGTQGVPYAYDVEATDPDGDILTFSLTSFPTGMMIDPSTGLITWMPPHDDVGSHVVTVSVIDGRGGEATQTFAIDVQNINRPPVAHAQTVSVLMDQSLATLVRAETSEITLTGEDDDGDALTFHLFDLPANGVLNGSPPNLTYYPNPCFEGQDSFTFKVNDGTEDSEIATVTVFVGIDCNRNGVVDQIDIGNGTSGDCNNNGSPDECDIAYNGSSFDDVQSWAAFDPGENGVGHNPQGYLGAVYDGRYVYYVPIHNKSGFHGEVLRYDTTGDFADTASWAAFDPGSNGVGVDPDGFAGAVFDGRFIYFVPHANGTNFHGEVLRYDTQGDFSDVSSWVSYDPAANGIGKNPRGFAHGVFDGQYVYFVPNQQNYGNDEMHGEVLRYDTTGDFTNPASWAAFDPGDNGVGIDPDGFMGAAFDGRYIFFAPYSHEYGTSGGEVLRYDTQGGFTDVSSWTTFDAWANGVGGATDGFINIKFDGRYVYFEPYAANYGPHGRVLRYDSQGDFTNVSSWTSFDTAANGVVTGPHLYRGGIAFDCRHVYFSPFRNTTGLSSEVLRYDTESGFTTASSWAVYNPKDNGVGKFYGYEGAVYDGRYVYFVPGTGDDYSSGEVLRYDTRIGSSDCNANGIPDECEGGPPEITSTPITTGTEGTFYQYDVEATDPDGDAIVYSLATAPVGMTIDPATGLIQWTPTDEQVGDNPVTVRVTDTGGLPDTQSFSVTVANTSNLPPEIISDPVTTTTLGVEYIYDVEAVDPDDDPLTYSLQEGPSCMDIDPDTGLITLPGIPGMDSSFATALGSSGQDGAFGVATDCQGNVYSAGHFRGTVDFDPGLGVYELTSVGDRDIYVTKFNPYGEFIWAARMGSSSDGDEIAFGVAVDSDNNVYVTGMFVSTADFDPGPDTFNLVSNGSNDIFICKLDQNGDFVWAESFGSSAYDRGYDIAIDNSDNIMATGYFRGTVDFDPGPDTYNLTSGSDSSAFVLKLDKDRNFLWASSLGDSGKNVGYRIDADKNDNVLVAGYFWGTNDFDPGPGVYELSSAGSWDAFIWKLDSEGNLVWAHCLGAGGIDLGHGVAVDRSGNVYVTGAFTDTADFDPGPGIYELTSAGERDTFVWKLDSEGNFVWAVRDGNSQRNEGNAIGVDYYGNVYLAHGTPYGGENIWKMDKGGNSIWTKYSPIVELMDISVSWFGSVSVSGYFSGNYQIDLGNETVTVPSAGDEDAIVIGLSSEEESPINVAVQVEDGKGGSDTQSFAINVQASNSPPVITSTPVITGTEDELYEYDVEASDEDGDAITYSLEIFPAGMTIDSATGLINWIPIEAQIGSHPVTVEVSDGNGGMDTQTFAITVEAYPTLNHPPKITSIPVTNGIEGMTYEYDVEAFDADNDSLTFSLTTSPAGMTIDPNTGFINWTPSFTDAGSHNVEVKVEDSQGGEDTQPFSIQVAEANNPPQITSTPITTGAEGVLYTYDVEAFDSDNDPLTFSLTTSPAGMTIDANTGLVSWTPSSSAAGTHAVEVRVEDGRGGWVTQTYTLNIGTNQPPIITSIPVTTGKECVLYEYDVEASDGDNDPLTFSLTSYATGMTIDAGTGLLTWASANVSAGAYPMEIRVEDGRGGWVTQTYTLTISANQPPVLSPEPVPVAFPDTLFTYGVDATDPDGDPLTYSLVTAPAGMTIDPNTGLIQWTPTSADVGIHPVDVHVTDTCGYWAGMTFNALVNNPPVITSSPITTGTVGALYEYDVQASDADNDPLTYSLTTSPAGMTIDPNTGLITWTPTAAQMGGNDVVVQVDDGLSGIVTQAFTVTVGADTESPVVTLLIIPDVIDLGEPATIQVTAADNVGVASKALTIDGAPVALDENGFATHYIDVAGLYTLVATAQDAAGNEALPAIGYLLVLDPADQTIPVVSLDLPADNSELEAPTEIVGTADDENLVYYVLEYSPVDKNTFTEFARGTLPVVDGVLGTLDPTLMLNGLYEIRLTAVDVNNNQATTSVVYRISGNQKVGNFTVTFTDLSIPVAGLPISVNRTYDSRDKSRHDFGIGWSLGIQTMKIEENMVPGEAWQQTISVSGWPPMNTYYLQPVGEHSVTVTWPDGRVEIFDFRVQPESNPLIPIQEVTALFAARTGTLSSLTPLGNNTLYVSGTTGNVELLDGDTLMPYDPDEYKLTDMDGTVYIISQTEGVKSIQEPNGNMVTFGPNGIIHSTGKSVTFTRDSENRITQITDPMGNTIEYSYDANGDLADVTDQEGYVTRFTYNNYHDLLDIIDPRGVHAVRNEYDDAGRLIAHTDAEGNRIEYTHLIDARQEIVTDRLGNVTVYEYDERGNVLQVTDPLGGVQQYTYDERDNKLSETDQLGNTTTYTYDTQNNMLTQTDPLGNTTSYTYNGQGQVLTITDPLGNVTTNTYDPSGNLLTTTDPLGNVTTNTYDSQGNLLSSTDCAGKVTTYEYDAYGNMVSQTDALGHVTTYTYDGNGNQLTQTTARTTESGPVTMTTTNEYDGLNQLVRTIDADGNAAVTEYNVLGKQSATVDKNGNWTTYEYDALGNLFETTYPDGTTDTSTYDANGNRITSTDRAGRTTQFVYDALNRVIQTIFSDSSSTSTQYDAAGRVIASTDENGNATLYEYDAVGRRTRVTDALGNETTFTYDANGNQISMTDANGNTTTNEYDALNRRTRTIFPDGTATSTTLDCLGRKISETDQAGITTQFEYDALGRLIGVIDALGGETDYTYDEVGNKTTQTDPNGNTTSWAYDNLGRVIKHTLPMGMFETFTYDPNGNMLTKIDFNGNTITYAYDVCCGRLLSKTYPDASQMAFTYTDSGQRETVTDSTGTTSYSYDLRGRLTQVVNPDGTSLTYTYDARGNRMSVAVPSGTTTCTYDALNRLHTVTDPGSGVTTYTYDTVGNRSSVTYPNGTVASYTYDSLNRLVYMDNRKSGGEIISSYTYTLGPAGNRTRVVENTGRVVDYTYDTLYRLTQEEITDAVLGNDIISYTYDAFGNRLTKTDSAGAISYTYNANDCLLTEDAPGYTNTYNYDNNGNTIDKSEGGISINYSYDFENRLAEALTDTDQMSYHYDADGIRTASTVNGVVTNYLVDKNRSFAQVIEEQDDSGGLIVSYVYGDDLISQERGGTASYYHYDGLGSTRALTDDGETVTDTYTYEAVGSLLGSTGSTENNYLFTGEQYDQNVGFYYLRARYYDQGVGRFMTMDTFHGANYDPLSLHKYLYTGANPVNNIDPSGHLTLAGNVALATVILAYFVAVMVTARIGIMNKMYPHRGAIARTENFLIAFSSLSMTIKSLLGVFIRDRLRRT